MTWFYSHRPAASAGAAPTVRSVTPPEAQAPSGLAHGYAQLVYRLRWLILALWLTGLMAGVPFAAQIGSALRGGGVQVSGSESNRVDHLLQARLHIPPSYAMVVFHAERVRVSDHRYQMQLQTLMKRVRTVPRVIGVRVGGVGRDGQTTYVEVDFDQNDDTSQQYMSELRALLPSARAGPARVYLTGTPATYDDLNTTIENDSKKAESIVLPLALVVLLIVFGTVLAALMPLLLALVAVPVALALLYAIAIHTWTSDFVLNIASIVGLGISIDYSLFMTRRFREQLTLGQPAREAMAWTVATAGVAILFSGLTVMIGFSGLFLIGIPFMTSFGIGGAVVVGVAMAAALTLLPAVLAVLGTRLTALRLPFHRHGQSSAGGAPAGKTGFWYAWARAVMRHPAAIIIGCVIVLAAAGSPVFALNPAAYGGSTLPTNTESQQGLAILSAAFPYIPQAPIVLAVTTRDGTPMLTARNLDRLAALTRWIAAQPHVTGVTDLLRPPAVPGVTPPPAQELVLLYVSGSYTGFPLLARFVSSTTMGDLTLVTVTSNTQLDSPAGKALIRVIRSGAPAAGRGLAVRVGGFQARSVDFSDYLYSTFPKVILAILLATYALLLVMFRSVVLPLKAVLVNILSLGAAYGVLVFVFQWGHFTQVLGFTSRGNVDATIPVLIYCLLFGLSMDYEVFLLSRIHEEWLRTGNNRNAVARGLAKTGGIITNAALLFSIVTGAFVFTSVLATKELGLGMTVAILVDATIIRALLVPAAMCVLGRWNWWFPGHPIPRERAAREAVEADSAP